MHIDARLPASPSADDLRRVRRAPFPLARRFLQICTTAVAEPLAREDLMPLDMGVLAYLNRRNGEPDIDQNGLAARLGIGEESIRSTALVRTFRAANNLAPKLLSFRAWAS